MEREKNVIRIPLVAPIALIILVILVLTTVLGGYVVSIAAKYKTANTATTEDGKFEYEVLEDGTIKITSYLGEGTKVFIPEKINNTVVTQIVGNAFFWNQDLKEINLPKTITTIGETYNLGNADTLQEINVSVENEYYSSENGVLFNKDKTELISYPTGKKSIRYSIPEGVTDIKYGAFSSCVNLKEIKIPSSLKYLYSDTFGDCNILEKINVASNNAKYSSKEGVVFNKDKTQIIAYPVAKSDTYYEIPETVTKISLDIFSYCLNLEEIKIPKAVTNIENNVYLEGKTLKKFNVEEDNQNYSSKEGVLFNKEKTQIICYPAAKSGTYYEIPETVVEIGESAFVNCTNLNQITIPEKVTSIGREAFERCENIEKINLPKGLTILGSSAFANCKHLKEINIPSTLTELEDNLFVGCSSLKQIKIPEGITTIGYASLAYCSNLEKVEIPDSVTTIEEYAFKSCEHLKEINISQNINQIGDEAFSECESLKDLDFPTGVTEIGTDVFSNSRIIIKTEIVANQEINLPEIVKRTMVESDTLYSEQEFTLSNCTLNEDETKLIVSIDSTYTKEVSLTINGGILNGLKFEFANVTDDWNYIYNILEDGTIEIDEYLENEMEVIIPETIEEKRVTNISGDAFETFDLVKKIRIPSGVRRIEDYTFSHMENLQEIEIIEGVTEIGCMAFMGCENLQKIILPEGITSIEDNAFWGCAKLTKISIPESVTEIYDDAFLQCVSLKEIEVAETNENYSSENGILFNKDKTEIIYYPAGKEETKHEIPEGVKTASSYVFDNCANLEEIVIPKTLENVSKGGIIFRECKNLKKITVSEENEYFASENGVLFNKEKTNLICYPNAKQDEKYDIPQGVTIIGEYAFYACKNIKEVNFPEGITTIRSKAFDKCEFLRRIEIPNTTTTIDSSAFSDNYNLEELLIPQTVKNFGLYTFDGSKITKVIALENSTTQEIELLETIRRTTQEGDALYSEEFELRNCEFNEDKTKLIINVESLQEEDVSLEILDGPLYNFELVLVPSGKITYSEEKITKDSVVATLHIADGETITNNEGKNTYTFTKNGEFTFEYTDANGNIKFATAKVENIDIEEEKKIYSDKYVIDDTYISNIQPKETIADLIEGIETNATEINVYNKKNELQSDTSKLATAMQIEFKFGSEIETRMIVVKGDVTGDGETKFTDMTMLNRYRLKKRTLEDVAILAADVTGDGKADFKDLVKINKYRLKKITEL